VRTLILVEMLVCCNARPIASAILPVYEPQVDSGGRRWSVRHVPVGKESEHDGISLAFGISSRRHSARAWDQVKAAAARSFASDV
jgi:hypothetical protein